MGVWTWQEELTPFSIDESTASSTGSSGHCFWLSVEALEHRILDLGLSDLGDVRCSGHEELAGIRNSSKPTLLCWHLGYFLGFIRTLYGHMIPWAGKANQAYITAPI